MRMTRQDPFVLVETPAKLNLHLQVLGRRPDGYHALETVMVSLGLFDTLRFAPAVEGELRLRQVIALSRSAQFDTSPQVLASAPATDDGNLVLRAARLLQAETGSTRGAAIDLIKRIPWQAGLGGGSSDAAATLVALNELWQLGLSRAELHPLAARLGSDVNFFLDSLPAAVCRGRGELIEPVPCDQRAWAVVAQPGVGLSTKEVFAKWSAEAEFAALSTATVRQWFTGKQGVGACPRPYNSLTRPASELRPEVGGLLRVLADAGCRAAGMSGSGSACFGLCASRRQALAVRRKTQARTGYWCVAAPIAV
jgi:4-diphosphocytidyl-2-C-methyl-D-erythritol kinase